MDSFPFVICCTVFFTLTVIYSSGNVFFKCLFFVIKTSHLDIPLPLYYTPHVQEGYLPQNHSTDATVLSNSSVLEYLETPLCISIQTCIGKAGADCASSVNPFNGVLLRVWKTSFQFDSTGRDAVVVCVFSVELRQCDFCNVGQNLYVVSDAFCACFW